MVKVILHADDSNGEIGGLISDLLEFHGVACDAGVADPVKLARWMVRFTIDDQDFFVLDPKRYANALGETGLTAYRKEVGRRREAGKTVFALRYRANAWPCSMAMSRGWSRSLVVIDEALPVHPGD